MAIPILNHMDFQKSAEIRNVRLHNQAASGVTSPGTGQILYDSGTIKFYNGSAWVALGTGTGSGTVTQIDGGDGLTGSVTSSGSLAVGAGTGITVNDDDVAITPAQTGITSVFNTSLKVGYGNAHAHIDFGTDNEINFDIDGTAQIVLKDGALEPVTDDDVDLGSSSKQFKNLYIDGTAEVDALTIGGVASVPFESADHSKLDGIAAGAEVNVATNLGKTTAAGQITITSSTGSNVVIGEATTSIAGLMSTTHHDKLDGIEASADVTDTANVKDALNASFGGSATIGDSSDTFTIPGNLVVSGTQTVQNETIQVVENNTIQFEGTTADAYEVKLTAADATSSDKTITLPNLSGHVALLASAAGETISATPAELNIMDGVTATTAELNIMDGVTSTTAELNILDGVTATASELNILDGVTATASELNILDGVTSTTAELNILDGVTSTAAELNVLDGYTGSVTELNYLDSLHATGVTATEYDYLDGVTSNIQTQLDAKKASADHVTKLLSGDASNTTYTITHGLATPIVSCTVLDYGNAGSGATYDQVMVEIKRNSDNAVDVVFASAPGTSQDYLVLVSKFPAIS
tara:strand:+ start:4095 stop:5846 length:1752 start_codon:yes stop_codon:yes gene_type:complete